MTDPEILGPNEIAPIKPNPDSKDQIIREMADEIREMDQLIWNLCQNYPDGHEHLRALQAKMERRKRLESNRISVIMQQELISVYTKPKG